MASCLRLVSTNSRTSSVIKSRCGIRNFHKRVPLPYPIADGLGDFLPPAALKTLVEYQDGLLSRLNDEVRADTKQESYSSVLQTAVTYASQRKRTLAFNYAVLALNNSFFLSQLSPPLKKDDHQINMSEKLAERIRTQYGETSRLKSTFSATALGMFSSGWVWFVADTGGELGVLPTFGPSTLLIRSRQNMNYVNGRVLGENDVDLLSNLNLPRPPSSPYSKTPHPSSSGPRTRNRFIHSTADPDQYVKMMREGEMTVARLQNVGDIIYPLFCVPVYEHAWMSAGFGVWGKEDWLKEFWTVLDWGKVSKAYDHALKVLL